MLSLFFSLLLSTQALGSLVKTPHAQHTHLGPLQEDAELALALKKKITSDHTGITKSWTGNDICTFQGFNCSTDPSTHQTVVLVDFNELELDGKDLTLFGLLDKLRDTTIFHANGNGFRGGVPKLPPNLFELDLSDNKLSGPFPETVLVPSLDFLDLRFNQFHGPVPPKAFDLDVFALFLNNNKFSGRIPENIGSSPAEFINLANNKLSGSIPRSLGRSEWLQEFLVLNNQLSGPLPTEWTSTNLTAFDVSYNALTGQVPEALCQLENIQIINLSHNHFSGTLGPACTKLVSEKVLDISNNCIKGAKNQKHASSCKGK
ncbi:hypothetical protein FOMA001_g19600 [Fusarium oxysporum f. sp. matthiolae]|nr:hypothetical protein FOMA001_g19600 [Fusarium oxysporum f. sp. matthiolae]